MEFQGGELRENTGTSYPINVPAGKKGTWYMANRSTYTNKITGQGSLTAYCTTEKGSNYYATRTPVQCNFSDFEGTLIPSSSQDDPAVLRFTLNIGGGMPKGTMQIAEKVEVQNNGRTFHIGKLTGNGALGGSCTFSNGSSVGANTWQVGNDDNWNNSVRVTSNANLVKLGTGKITWNAVNTNSGTTNITEGELCLGNNGRLGTGKLTIGANGTLSGISASNNALTNSSIEVNGTVRPGSYEGASSGAINFGSKNVTFNENSSLVIGASRCATAIGNGCAAIEGIGTLTINGTIKIVPTKTNRLAVGDSIRIWKANTFVGNPTVVCEEGITWNTSRLNEGLLFVEAISVGINEVLNNAIDSNDIYDLRGRLVRKDATDTKGLPEGIYIRGGKKIVVK